MIQLGIRLHDVNTALPADRQTLEARAEKAREEGFSCVHLALAKCIKGVTFDDAALTEGLKMGLDEQVLLGVTGCLCAPRLPGE